MGGESALHQPVSESPSPLPALFPRIVSRRHKHKGTRNMMHKYSDVISGDEEPRGFVGSEHFRLISNGKRARRDLTCSRSHICLNKSKYSSTKPASSLGHMLHGGSPMRFGPDLDYSPERSQPPRMARSSDEYCLMFPPSRHNDLPEIYRVDGICVIARVQLRLHIDSDSCRHNFHLPIPSSGYRFPCFGPLRV